MVTDHDSGDVIWVAEGKSSEVLKSFFNEIGPEACEAIEIVTIDMSAAYRKAILESLPNAQIVYDHFHIAKLANEALNEVRRELVREADDKQKAAEIKGTMWPLLHRIENATEKHLEVINRLRPTEPLGRGYLLKEAEIDDLMRAILAVHEGGLLLQPAMASQLIEGLETDDTPALTPRELEVLHLLAAGARNREIADQLSLSVNTVKYHIENLYEKLGVRSRTQAVRVAGERGLSDL